MKTELRTIKNGNGKTLNLRIAPSNTIQHIWHTVHWHVTLGQKKRIDAVSDTTPWKTEKGATIIFHTTDLQGSNIDFKNTYNRDDFMAFFRSDAYAEELSTDDKLEIFLGILPGKSDITKELLDQLLCEYSVETIDIQEIR